MAGLDLIEAPAANSMGTAELSYPLRVPEGHNGLTPSLALSYSSASQNGWLGVGWTLPISAIEVDTRFGVPRYDGHELFLLDGERLTPIGTRSSAGCALYRRRVEQTFDRIERCGDPTQADQYWVVTDQSGTRHTYGLSTGRLADPEKPEHVARWSLEEVEDTFENRLVIQYARDDQHSAPALFEGGPSWVQLYPTRMSYAHGASGAHYYVRFATAPGREDVRTSAAFGFLTVNRQRLSHVDVGLHNSAGQDEIIRRYELRYTAGEFGHSLLSSVASRGRNAAEVLYQHDFEYHQANGAAETGGSAGTISRFSEPVQWGSNGQAGSGLSEGANLSGGISAFAGIAPDPCLNPVGVGVSVSLGGSWTTSLFEDVNGDGLPDLVSNGRVYTQSLAEGRSGGSFSLSPSAAFVAKPISSFDVTAGFEVGLRGLFSAAASSALAWSFELESVDDVNGDGILDLVRPGGQVTFNPGRTVSYDLGSGSMGAIDSGSENLDAETEARLEEGLYRTSPLLVWKAVHSGRLHVGGPVSLASSQGGDGVQASIDHEDHAVWTRHLTAEQGACIPNGTGTCGDGLVIDVKKGESIYFRVDPGADIKLDRTSWSPTIDYETVCLPLDPPFDDTLVCHTLDESEHAALDGLGLPLYHYRWSNEEFRLLDARSSLWAAQARGRVTVDARLILHRDVPFEMELRAFAARSGGHRTVDGASFVDQGVYSTSFDIEVSEGEVLQLVGPFSEQLLDPARDALLEGAVRYTELCGSPYDATGACVPVLCNQAGDDCEAGGIPVDASAIRAPIGIGDRSIGGAWDARALSGGFRSWYYGEWTSQYPFTARAVVEALPPPEGQPPYVTRVLPSYDPIRRTDPIHFEHAGPLFTGRGADFSIAAGELKPSRIGGMSAQELVGGRGGLRKYFTDTWSAEVGAGFSIQGSTGATVTQAEFLDLNGDSRPDVISRDGIQYQTCSRGPCDGVQVGAFETVSDVPGLGELPALRKIANRNTRWGIGMPANSKQSADSEGKSKSSSSILPSAGKTFGTTEGKARFLDVNGDGLPDHLEYARNSQGTPTLLVRLNLGYRFAPAVAWPMPGWSQNQVTSAGGADEVRNALQAADPNALELQDHTTNSFQVAYKGFGGGPAFSASRTIVDFFDINGDGLPDQVRKDPGQSGLRVKLNLGHGFANEGQWADADWGVALENPVMKVLNGSNDTLSFSEDWSANAGIGVPICIPLSPVGVPFLAIEIAGTVGGGQSAAQMSLQDMDGDGQLDRVLKLSPDPLRGNADKFLVQLNQTRTANLLSKVKRPGGGSVAIEYERQGNRVDHNAEPKVDMPRNQWVLAATVMDDGQGRSYRQHHDYFDSGFFDRQEREDYGYARVKTTREDGSTLEVDYHNQDYYSRGLPARRVERDAAGMLYVVEDYYYERLNNGEAPLKGWAFTALTAQATRLYEGGTADLNDTLAARQETRIEYADFDDLGHARSVRDFADEGPSDDLVQKYQFAFDRSKHLTTLTRESVLDAAGEVLRETVSNYTDEGALSLRSLRIAGGLDPDTGAAYTQTSPGWLDTRFAYDARGNLIKQTDPTGYQVCQTYDSVLGLYAVETVDNLSGRPGAQCDSGNPEDRGYAMLSVPNYYFAEAALVTDPNGNSTQFGFDAFGRPSHIWSAHELGEPEANATVRFEYAQGQCEARTASACAEVSGCQAVNGSCVTQLAWASALYRDVTASDADPIETVAFVDGLGRTIQTKQEIARDSGDTLGGMAVTERGFSVSGSVDFDVRGRPVLVGQPRFSQLPARQLVLQSARHPMRTSYDVLGRVRRVEAPNESSPTGSAVSTIDHDFDRLDGVLRGRIVQTDAEGKRRVSYESIDGRTLAVEQFNTLGGSMRTLRTHYEYNTLGELERVRDPKGNLTEARYDSVGRLVSLNNPDTGLVTYSYRRDGNLGAYQTAALRANNQRVTFHYAPQSTRLQRTDYPTSDDLVYEYGSPAERGILFGHVAGRLKTETSKALQRRFKYDSLGQVTRRETEFAKQPFRSRPYTYALDLRHDALGRILSMRYPDELVTYGYDAGGRVKRVQGVDTQAGSAAGEATSYLQHQGYDEFGDVTRRVAGNGVETQFVFQPMSRLPSEVNADHRDPLLSPTRPNRAFQRLRYTYDRVGNVVAMQNEAPFDPTMRGEVQVGAVSQTFKYDDLYQLTSARGVQQVREDWRFSYQQAFIYDELGNIVGKGQAAFGEVVGAGGGLFGRTDLGLYGECTPLNGAFPAYVPEGGWNITTTDTESTFCLNYAYGSARPHAPTRVEEQRAYSSQLAPLDLTYDANGNQTVWNWPGRHRIRLGVDDANQVNLAEETGYFRNATFYDGDGDRALHVEMENYEETAYLGRELTILNGEDLIKHIFVGDTRIATKLNPDWFDHAPTNYYHPDHLGSANFVSNDDQELVEHNEYYPSGESWRRENDAGYTYLPHNWFTGKEYDATTKLNYHGARYYNPHLSQWTQPDPILASYMQGAPNGGVFDPSNLGLYGYVGNNPVNYVDPDGLTRLANSTALARNRYKRGPSAPGKKRPNFQAWKAGREAQHLIPDQVHQQFGLGGAMDVDDAENGMMIPAGNRAYKVKTPYKAGILRPKHIKAGLAHPYYNKAVSSFLTKVKKAAGSLSKPVLGRALSVLRAQHKDPSMVGKYVDDIDVKDLVAKWNASATAKQQIK